MRVLIVDDHEVVRDGVKRILEELPGRTTFGEASTAAEALRLAREERWDVAVVDLSLGSRSGLDMLRDLKRILPRLPVLMFSMLPEEQYARPAFKAGAAGYLTKGSPRRDLLTAVAKVIKGGRYVSPALAERLASDLERDGDRPPHEALSSREFEVMRLIASGRTVGEIARVLSLSAKTVSTYRARVLEKMRVKSSAELMRYAFQNGLVD